MELGKIVEGVCFGGKIISILDVFSLTCQLVPQGGQWMFGHAGLPQGRHWTPAMLT